MLLLLFTAKHKQTVKHTQLCNETKYVKTLPLKNKYDFNEYT